MKKFIIEVEKQFDDNWQNVIDKGISLLLTPIESVEVIYLYLNRKDNSFTRDMIMFKIADLSLSEISKMFEKIKREIVLTLSKK